jgi:spore coat protein A
MLPGEEVTFTYPVNQQAGTLWYHDHAMGITRLNVMMGLAGFFIVRDPVEQALGLPAGEYEIALAIQDRSFHADGSLEYPEMWMDHFFGDKMLVNGKVWPYLQVRQGKYRFRVLNGCNSRVLRLGLSNGATFQVIGTDLGLLPAPVPRTSLLLTSGERAEIVIDFASYPPGTQIVLTNDAPAPFPGEAGVGVIPNVMRFDVVGTPGHVAGLPAALRPVPPIDTLESVATRDLVLRKGDNPCTGSMWMVNDLMFDDITESPVLGSTEIWRFINESGISHPMHMHLVAFQVLDRQPFILQDGEIVVTGPPVPPDPSEAGWKDTAPVGPDEILRVIARFEDYTGHYPYHCHILEHEDNEMMRQFQVVSPVAVGDGSGPKLELLPNLPNPFSVNTTIRYELPIAANVRLAAFDIAGRRVRSLAGGRKDSGSYVLQWDGRDEGGRRLPSGVYLLRLEVGGDVVIRKSVLVGQSR